MNLQDTPEHQPSKLIVQLEAHKHVAAAAALEGQLSSQGDLQPLAPSLGLYTLTFADGGNIDEKVQQLRQNKGGHLKHSRQGLGCAAALSARWLAAGQPAGLTITILMHPGR